MRPGDVVARFSGEEFAVILPETTIQGAWRVAIDICENLHERHLPHRDNPLGIVTASIGCASLRPQLGCHASSLIELADRALYDAKRGGRNCVSGLDLDAPVVHVFAAEDAADAITPSSA